MKSSLPNSSQCQITAPSCLHPCACSPHPLTLFLSSRTNLCLKHYPWFKSENSAEAEPVVLATESWYHAKFMYFQRAILFHRNQYRIIKSWRGSGWKGLLEVKLVQTCLFQQGHPEPASQDHVQAAPE